ncbi:hypothetical protein F4779DRAFT_257012 [Xylariaceae sp. FL0662B]|nr:hypothetical protein F4779DRAFT_257012 [Xylariaceae sp. FL0662B]
MQRARSWSCGHNSMDHGTSSATSVHEGVSGPSPGGSASAGARSVKRPRPVKSCLECRRRKLRCDRLFPCSQCQKSQRTCRYVADGEAGGSLSDASDADMPERAFKRNRGSTSQDTNQRNNKASAAVLDEHEARLDRLEKILLSRNSSVPESSNSLNQRPVASPLTVRGLTVKGGLRTRFFGQNSTRVLVNLFDEAKDFMFNRNSSSDIREQFLNIQKIHEALQDEHRKVTTPIAVFVDSMTPIQKRMADVLPSKAVCDTLVHIYLTGSETIYRVLHVPSFRNQYDRYWEGNPQPDAFLPQLLSLLCVGYRFVGIGKCQYHDREGIHIATASALVRTWLEGLRGKQLVEFSTLQAETLQLMAQRMINPQSQEFWTHLGLIVRRAMTMGLHRDPSEFPQYISPFWAEQRRKLWYTILELDVHMSMQCNLPCCVREGDFTCLPPRNLNDDDIHPLIDQLPPSKPIEQDTDSRIQVFAASTLAIRIKIADLVNRIDSVQDYHQIIALGNELERALEDVRYIVPLSHSSNMKEIRRQWVSRVVLDINCRRPLLALYRPFALSSPDAPQQIMTGYLRSSMVLLSYLDELDPSCPDYQQFWHMLHIVLKQDIIQAAFSVCYYIKQATDDAVSPKSSIWSPGAKTDPPEDSCTIASESSILLSPPRLRHAVQRTLDNMIERIREIETDIKDLISLTVVFNMYQGGSREQKEDAIKKGMQALLEAGLQSIHANHENIASMPIIPSPLSAPMNTIPANTGYMNQMQPFMAGPDIPNNVCPG